MQTKSQELNTQFAETSKQLEELRIKQKALEARNQVLEKLMILNQQQNSEGDESTGEVRVQYVQLIITRCVVQYALKLGHMLADVIRNDQCLA